MHIAFTAPRRLALIGLLLAVLSLSACSGGPPAPTSWPGVTLSGNTAYIAYNQSVWAVDLANRTKLWGWSAAGGADTFYGAPAVTADRLILGGYGLGDVYAIPLNGGQALWGYTPDPGNVIPGLDILKHPNGNIVAGTAVSGSLAYAGLNTGFLYAIDTANGQLRWQFRTPDRNGFWSTPVLVGDTLYATSLGHQLYAFDAATGALRGDPLELGAPIASDITITGTTALVGTFDNRVLAIDLQSRAIIWQHPVDGWVWGAPQVFGNKVYAGTLQGTVYELTLDKGDEVWHKTLTSSDGTVVQIRAPLLVTDKTIFVAARNGWLHALKREQGGPDLWAPQPIAGSQLLSKPQLWHHDGADDVIVAPMGIDTLLSVRNAADGTEVWAFKP